MNLAIAIGLSIIMYSLNVFFGATIPMWIVLAPTVLALVLLLFSVVIVGAYLWILNKLGS